MQIVINIDETLFDGVIKSQLENIPPEEIQQLIKDCIVQRLTCPTIDENGKKEYNLLDKFFFEQYNYGYSPTWKPSKLLEDVLRSIDYSDVATRVKDTVLDYVANHKKDLTEELIYKFISDGIAHSMYNNPVFTTELYHKIKSEIYASKQ
jgi:hypothetical protein